MRQAVGVLPQLLLRGSGGLTWQQQTGSELWSLRPALFLRNSTMAKNWIVDGYMNGGGRPDRYQRPEGRWLQLQANLNRWGKSHTWRRLEQLGQIAKTD